MDILSCLLFPELVIFTPAAYASAFHLEAKLCFYLFNEFWNEMSSCSWHFTESFLKDLFRNQKGHSKHQKRGLLESIIV
jgi:hypothetical protein